MLGSDGSAWLERLHMQLARNLKSSGWSQAEIADILGSTQSTISRMAHRELPAMAGTSDQSTIDGWAHEISLALRQLGPGAKPSRTRFVMEVAFAPGQVLRFDKSLTGTDLDSDQEQHQQKGGTNRRHQHQPRNSTAENLVVLLPLRSVESVVRSP